MKKESPRPEPIPTEKAREMINEALNKVKSDKEKGILKPISKEKGLKQKLNIETKE
jgi:hypothetical protein